MTTAEPTRGRTTPRTGTWSHAGSAFPTLEAQLQAGSESVTAVEDVTAPEPGAAWTLVQLTKDGDSEAFGLIYDTYAKQVFTYIYFRVHEKPLAEDFTQETFTRALKGIDKVHFQGVDVAAWLITIARNIIRDFLKSSRYKLEVTSDDMRDADRATEGPENAVIDKMMSAELINCVKQLSPEQQECIVLRFFQGFSVSETAAIMGRKDGAIKALQHRAVKRLYKLLPDGLR